MDKGVSLISGVIFLAITITTVTIIYQAGVPVVKRMQDAASIEQMKAAFSELDEIIRQVAAEGTGSRRTVQMVIDSGEIFVNGTQDAIYWELNTDAAVISPRTRQISGNVVVGSNLNTRVYEENYTRVTPQIECYVMENERMKVYIRKVGGNASQTGWQNFNTSSLVIALYNKGMDEWLENEGFFEVIIDDNANSKSGNGYTLPAESGYNLPYGKITAYMNSSYLSYFLDLILESGADFLEIEAST
jgi:hypothetical protein